MPSYNSRPERTKNQLVLGVGSRAYVNWAPPAGQPARPVPMLDDSGQLMTNDLADGQEVEVLSWRPRSREGVAYQIRRLSDGREWWLAANYLRRLQARQAAPPPERIDHLSEGAKK